MQGSERLYLAYLTENWPVGASGPRNPQHLTLVPPFQASPKAAAEAASSAAHKFSPFTVQVSRRSHLSRSRSIPVFLIEPNQALIDLHTSLIGLVAARGIDVESLSHTKTNYRPHITLRPSQQTDLQVGQTLLIDHIAVIQKVEEQRIVIAKEYLQ